MSNRREKLLRETGKWEEPPEEVSLEDKIKAARIARLDAWIAEEDEPQPREIVVAVTRRKAR